MNVLGKFFAFAALGALAIHFGTRAVASRPTEQADRRLQEKIQRYLAGRVADPEAIEVVVNAGDVSLRGELPAEEVDGVLSSVLALPGVKHVHNRLTPLEPGVPRSTIQDAMQLTLP